MNREEAKYYLQSSGFSEEQIDTIEKAFTSTDAISRQAVQDYIAKYLSQYLYNDVREAVEVIDEYIEELPSVTPQPCEDAIDRNLVCAFIDGLISDDEEREKGLEYIRSMPPVNPQEPKTDTWSIKDVADTFKKHGLIREQEPKTGHWIEHPEIETSTPEYLMFYECSECGDRQCFCKSDIHKKRFCSNCGCRMVEPQERSDKA